MNPRRRPSAATVARLGAELMVIVVGVLIALAGQSWWENRAVEQDRERTLRLLLDDVSRLETTLRGSARSDSVLVSIRDLLAGRYAASDSLLRRQIVDAFWSFGFEIGPRDGEDLLPAYADLKNSGRLALLPDTVRARMPAIELQLAVLSRFLDDVVYHQQERVDPVLYENFELDFNPDLSSRQFALVDPRAHLAVLRNREVRNLLVLKSNMMRGQAALWRDTADSLAVLAGLIRAAQGGS